MDAGIKSNYTDSDSNWTEGVHPNLIVDFIVDTLAERNYWEFLYTPNLKYHLKLWFSV